MKLKPGTKGGLRTTIVLMTASILLLAGFVGYWLKAQHKERKTLLVKELRGHLTEIQREYTDSVIFERYIGDALKDIKAGKMVKGAMSPDKKKVTVRFNPSDSAKGFIQRRTKIISTRLGDMDSVFEEINMLHTDSTSVHERTVFISDKSASPTFNKGNKITLMDGVNTTVNLTDSPMIIAIESLLRTALRESMGDSLSKLFVQIDSVSHDAIHKAFDKKLKSLSSTMHATWPGEKVAKKDRRDVLAVPYVIYNNPGAVVITGYRAYLLQKVIPEMLFGTVLIAFVLLAFIVTYRSLKRQIKLGEMKNSLISNMSHELKTPVATVKVALEAMSDYGVINNPQQAAEYIQMARLETQRLEMLINKALNTSLMEQGRLSLQYEPADITLLTKEIIQSLTLRLQQHNTQINLSAEGDDFNINIDKLHVQGAILNIIDNSIKYGTAPVIINIHIIAQSATVTVNISDNGPGIAPEYAEQIFEKFFRVPTGDKHNVQGYGLGLSYVKQVMQLHGGMVQQRNNESGGSKFTLQFFRGR